MRNLVGIFLPGFGDEVHQAGRRHCEPAEEVHRSRIGGARPKSRGSLPHPSRLLPAVGVRPAVSRQVSSRQTVQGGHSLTVIPFENGKLKVNVEVEYLKESFNQNDYEWIWSDFAGWKAAAVGSSKVANSVNTPSLAYAIWTPVPNFQAVINGSWLWTAKTVYDKTRAMPGSAAYTKLSAAAKVASDIYYGARIENVPEYRFNAFGKYTFTDGMVRGLAVGTGMRYSSETVVSRSVDWNPLKNGYQAGDYVVFDLTLTYPWDVAGFNFRTSLGIYNVTDEDYSEGSFALSPQRNWLLSNTLEF